MLNRPRRSQLPAQASNRSRHALGGRKESKPPRRPRTRSLDSLVDEYYEPALRLLMRLADSVEAGHDLAQTTFLKIILRGGTHTAYPAADWAYVRRTAYNTWASSLRERRPELMSLDELTQVPDDQPAALDAISDREELLRLYAELRSLPVNHLVATILIVVDRMTYNEAAALMDAPRETVAKWRARALRRLRGALTAAGVTGGQEPASRDGKRRNASRTPTGRAHDGRAGASCTNRVSSP